MDIGKALTQGMPKKKMFSKEEQAEIKTAGAQLVAGGGVPASFFENQDTKNYIDAVF